ncbi:MAG TPA: cell envelope integrity protein TolA [Candidatus Eisenbacteria bacterium]|nr:cell envelope integrity protein TolA [Candidatus Eisenbacteria bacterium]
MTRRFTLAALLLAMAMVAMGCAAGWNSSHGHPAANSAPAEIGFYFDDLAPYGTWIDVDTYGWVWCPLDTPVGWRPYTVGYWAYSDDGWLWVSEDPWGWIPYHYGRWTWARDYGWFWVPGDVWAPAWVAWRYGPGWVGWAPLPPDVYWRPGVGLMYTDLDLDRHIHRYRWCFTPSNDFGTTRERVRVEPPGRNVTLIGKTRNVTKYVAGPRPVEEGMRPELTREERAKPIERFQIVDSKTPIRDRGVTFRERSVEVYRPEGGVTQTVHERVRDVPPTERPVAPRKAVERLQKEQTQIDEVVKRQRQELTEEHEKEMRERPTGASAMELRRQQEEELRAQREVEERQKREVEARERQVLKQQEKAAREEERGADERQREATKETKKSQEETRTRTR